MVYDMYQAVRSGSEYFTEGWNLVDMSHIFLGFVNIGSQLFLGTWHIISKIVLILVVLLTMMKSFYFMRIWEIYSPIVMRLLNVVKGMFAFMVFYTVLIFLFSMTFNVFGPLDAPEYKSIGYFLGGLFYSLRFSVGDFDFSPALS